MQFLAGLGHTVLGVDRNAEALKTASQWGETLQADIENAAWPLRGRSFKGVVVTNYLWRDLFPQILNSVAEGGVLIYETFSQGNQASASPLAQSFYFNRVSFYNFAQACELWLSKRDLYLRPTGLFSGLWLYVSLVVWDLPPSVEYWFPLKRLIRL